MNIDLLNKIQPVDVPEHLLLNILQQVKHKPIHQLSARLTLGIAASFLLLVLLNITLVVRQQNEGSRTSTPSYSDFSYGENLYNHE